MTNQNEAIKAIRQYANAHEVYQKTSFECSRLTSTGTHQTVTVEILDAGSQVNPELRYQCVVTRQDGRQTTGNTASSIEDALSIVHWTELDLPIEPN